MNWLMNSVDTINPIFYGVQEGYDGNLSHATYPVECVSDTTGIAGFDLSGIDRLGTEG